MRAPGFAYYFAKAVYFQQRADELAWTPGSACSAVCRERLRWLVVHCVFNLAEALGAMAECRP